MLLSWISIVEMSGAILLFLVLLCVAAFFVFWKSPPVAASSKRMVTQPSSAKFKQVMTTPPASESPELLGIRQKRETVLKSYVESANLEAPWPGYLRPPAAPGWKAVGLPSDTNWKDLLITAPFELDRKFEITIYYNDSGPRSLAIFRVLEGFHDYYLKAMCFQRGAVRTFAVKNVGPLVTSEGKRFSSGAEWLNSLPTRLTSVQPKQL